jgi:hypothetical protein
MSEAVNYWRSPPAMQALIRYNRDALWKRCGGDEIEYRRRLIKLKLRGFPI